MTSSHQILDHLTVYRMKPLLHGFAALALFACAVVAVDLDGCQRGSLNVGSVKGNPFMRREIKKAFGFSLDRNGTFAGVLVQSKDGSELVYAVFAGRHKGGKAVTFEFDVGNHPSWEFRQIPFGQFFSYLECEELLYEGPDSD